LMSKPRQTPADSQASPASVCGLFTEKERGSGDVPTSASPRSVGHHTLSLADRSLYEAKHRGRNQAVFADPLGIS
jgi:hypothetical protein